MNSSRLSFVRALALVGGAAACSSTTSNPGPTDVSGLADTAVDGVSPSDSSVADTSTTTDGGGEVPVDDGSSGNKCRYTAGASYGFLDCGPGKVCTMAIGGAIPTCEAASDAGSACGTIQCANSCSCLDPAKSICDCFGAAIGPLAPPELALS